QLLINRGQFIFYQPFVVYNPFAPGCRCVINHIDCCFYCGFYCCSCAFHSLHMRRFNGYLCSGFQRHIILSFLNFLLDDPFMVCHTFPPSGRSVRNSVGNRIICPNNRSRGTLHSLHVIGFYNCFTSYWKFWVFSLFQTFRNLYRVRISLILLTIYYYYFTRFYFFVLSFFVSFLPIVNSWFLAFFKLSGISTEAEYPSYICPFLILTELDCNSLSKLSFTVFSSFPVTQAERKKNASNSGIPNTIL